MFYEAWYPDGDGHANYAYLDFSECIYISEALYHVVFMSDMNKDGIFCVIHKLCDHCDR